FDHNVDYPCFLLTRWDQSAGTERELRVFGPPPTVELTEKLIGPEGAFSPDYLARMHWSASQRVFMNRGGTLPRLAPRVLAEDISAGFRHEGTGWSVQSTAARHAQPHLESIAYRMRTRDGDIVFTGDTEPCDSVQELAQGADVMLCMAWDTDEQMQHTGEMVGSCGVGGAARMATEAGVQKLVLVHVGPRVSRPWNRTAA
ncbi:beta-lactamase family protein, partial [mine drainage metagenome]